ncbi:unnamed protein product [Tuber melanosporum]|uniref:Ribose-phosphate pyrophosphokinase 1 n=1 Tax=Tuber melanosporum (strain Mel28) TaxID=656061 RepID=D5GPW5_TUBMM|nr:uncharacterized protein GSTUM_00012078001 [Tuber melanosporum]CAZ86567.1 unnamed protein product [Tuber melanosporum]
MRRVKIFSGTSHPGLTEAICERLGTTLGKCDLKKFSNGETSVDIGCSIRDQDVFIVQSGSAKANDSIMELLILISACKGGSANKITAVMPYFPYSKQSKKKSHRGAITARMLANLLTVAGVDHVITVDLHASQMQGFFTKPVDNLYAEPLLARWIRHTVPNWRDSVVVSKNPGGTKRVTQLADVLKLNFALITTDRRRKEDADQIPGNEKMITLVGEVRRKTVLIVDDMIDRAGSWISAAEHVKLRGGAKKVICIATHGVFGGNCLKEMEDCSCIDQIVVTNSFPIPEDKRKGVKKLVTIDLSQLLSEAIRRNHHGKFIPHYLVE